MNYLRIYNNIIYTAQQRTLPKDTYKERHHFIPRCMNGPDDNWNIVKLTAKEHYICHHVLTKIYPDNSKIIFAFWIMCNWKSNTQKRYVKINASTYAYYKKQYSIANSIANSGKNNGMYGKTFKMSEEAKQKIRNKQLGVRNHFYGKTHSIEARRKIGEKSKGRIPNAATRLKMSNARLGIKFTENVRQNISKGLLGHVVTPETRAKLRLARLGKPGACKGYKKTKMATCQYCNKTTDVANIKRWHNEKCKSYTKQTV